MFYRQIITVLLTGLLIVGKWLLPADMALASMTTATAADPTVPLNQLELMLKPLTKDELEVEAEAWLALLKAKVTRISNAEIAVKLKKQEVETTQKAIETIEQVRELKREAANDRELPPKSNNTLELTQQVKDALQEAADIEAKTRQKDLQEAISTATEKAEVGEVVAKSSQKVAAIRVNAVDPEQRLEKATEQLEEAVETKTEIKKQLLVNLNELRIQQTAIAEHLKMVLNELEAKGGEVNLYRLYIDAVSTIAIDVSDTQETWIKAIGWLKSKAGGLRWVQNISTFLAIVAIFTILGGILSEVVDKSLSAVKLLSYSLRKFLVNSVSRMAIATGIIFGLIALKIDISPLLTTIGAASVVLGFAWRQPLGNFANGLVLMLYRPFDVGDEVEIAGVLGVVSSMNLAFTEINTGDNKIVAVPNDAIWSGAIANLTAKSMRCVDLSFHIRPGKSFSNVQQILEEVLAAHPLVLKTPQPEVRIRAEGTVILRPWVKTDDYWQVYWDISRTVKGLSISYSFPEKLWPQY